MTQTFTPPRPPARMALACAWQDQAVVSALFRQHAVAGTFVLYDPQTGTDTGHDETRARQRAAMERRLSVEKGQSSPVVQATETGGRGFVQGEELGLEIDNPLFNPAAVGNPLHAVVRKQFQHIGKHDGEKFADAVLVCKGAG